MIYSLQDSRLKFCMYFESFSCVLNASANLFPRTDLSNDRYKTTNLLIMHFLSAFCYFRPLRSEYFTTTFSIFVLPIGQQIKFYTPIQNKM
jgi:hypothetical protein